MPSIFKNRIYLSLLCCLSIGILFGFNHQVSLWDQDEAAYAGFALNMLEKGDWLIPDFLWSEVHRKPPLHLWAIASSYAIFGVNEFAVRFPSTLAVIGTHWVLYFMGKSIFGKPHALSATVMMACSLLLLTFAKISLTDAFLLFFETVAVLSIYNYLLNPHLMWQVLFCCALGLGILVKGPPILILVIGILGFLVLFYPNKTNLWQLQPGWLIAIALMPVLIWGRLAWQIDDGAYIRWMLDWYVLQRVSGGIPFGQWGPPGYFLGIYLLAFLPWAMFMPAACVHHVKNCFHAQPDEHDVLLGAWLLCGWLFYELIPSKLPTYALGAYPAFALMLAQQINRFSAQKINNHRLWQWGLYLFLSLSIVLLIALLYLDLNVLEQRPFFPVFVFVIIWSIITLGTFWAYRRSHVSQGIIGSTLQALTLMIFVWLIWLPALESVRSTSRRVAQEITNQVSTETPIYFAKRYNLPSLPFYLQQQGFSVKDGSELSSDDLAMTIADDRQKVVMTDLQTASFVTTALQTNQNLTFQVQTIAGWAAEFGQTEQYFLIYAMPVERLSSPKSRMNQILISESGGSR